MAITEDHLEQLALTWFQDSGWEYLYGPDIARTATHPSALITGRCCCKGACTRRCAG